jgi:hypothetical protein
VRKVPIANCEVMDLYDRNNQKQNGSLTVAGATSKKFSCVIVSIAHQKRQ